MNIDLSKTQKYLEWLKTKLYLDSITENAKTRKVKRGQVYWCHFGYNVGSEMSKESPRPCVIIQKDVINIKSPNTIVVPITHDTSTVPCLVPINTIKNEEDEVILDGKVNVSNILCVSKARLTNYIATLSNSEIKAIDEAIAKQLNLYTYYNEISDKLNDKVEYIQKIKTQRNIAEDKLKEIMIKLNVDNEENIIDKIDEMLDKH